MTVLRKSIIGLVALLLVLTLPQVTDAKRLISKKRAVKKPVQVLKTTYTNYDDIVPSDFTVKVGSPVRFEVTVKESDYGCMSTILIPDLYDTPKLLRAGKKIVMEFTPTKTGLYDITCAMGVPRGSIKVVK